MFSCKHAVSLFSKLVDIDTAMDPNVEDAPTYTELLPVQLHNTSQSYLMHCTDNMYNHGDANDISGEHVPLAAPQSGEQYQNNASHKEQEIWRTVYWHILQTLYNNNSLIVLHVS